jgi:hypothetical protein
MRPSRREFVKWILEPDPAVGGAGRARFPGEWLLLQD